MQLNHLGAVVTIWLFEFASQPRAFTLAHSVSTIAQVQETGNTNKWVKVELTLKPQQFNVTPCFLCLISKMIMMSLHTRNKTNKHFYFINVDYNYRCSFIGTKPRNARHGATQHSLHFRTVSQTGLIGSRLKTPGHSVQIIRLWAPFSRWSGYHNNYFLMCRQVKNLSRIFFNL